MPSNMLPLMVMKYCGIQTCDLGHFECSRAHFVIHHMTDGLVAAGGMLDFKEVSERGPPSQGDLKRYLATLRIKGYSCRMRHWYIYLKDLLAMACKPTWEFIWCAEARRSWQRMSDAAIRISRFDGSLAGLAAFTGGNLPAPVTFTTKEVCKAEYQTWMREHKVPRQEGRSLSEHTNAVMMNLSSRMLATVKNLEATTSEFPRPGKCKRTADHPHPYSDAVAETKQRCAGIQTIMDHLVYAVKNVGLREMGKNVEGTSVSATTAREKGKRISPESHGGTGKDIKSNMDTSSSSEDEK